MNLRLGSSLKFRIAAVAGLIFLAGIALIGWFTSRILHADMRDLVSQEQLTAASYIARDINGKIALRRDALKRVALNIPPTLIANPAALQKWLEDRKAINTMFPSGLLIIPPDGTAPLAEIPRQSIRPPSFADRDWFREVIASRDTIVSQPLIARTTQEPSLVIATPIFDTQNNPQAILAGITPLASPGFLDLIQNARPGPHGSYQLISPRLRIFTLSSDNGSAVSPLPVPGNDPIIDQAMAGVRGARIITNAQGHEELVAIVAVPHPDWLLVARQPGVEAFTAVSNTQRNILLITALLVVTSFIMLVAALSRMLQPLALLANELRDMAESRHPIQPVQTAATDEVADVANSFNRLHGRLLEQERRLAEMAHHDALTGLPNRLLITDRLENNLRQIPRVGQSLAVLLIDLDGFKKINDSYGQQVGDRLLIEVAARLNNCIRHADTIGRLSGDEFLILLSPAGNPFEAAERVAEKCLTSLARPILIADLSLTISASIGIAVCEKEHADSTTASQLMSHADVAMQRAKAASRNSYAFYAAPHHPTSPTHV